MRTGCQWRDLPEAFGLWSTPYKRFNAWSAAEKLMMLSGTLVDDPDIEWLPLCQSTPGHYRAATEETETIGKNRAGNASNIHLAFDAYGLPDGFRIMSGEVHNRSPGIN
ncbi:hypothetical protein HACA111877_16775 [Halomonas casei]